MTFIKAVDLQGRITLPIELLKIMGVKHNQMMEVRRMTVNGQDCIVLHRYVAGCFLCGKLTVQTLKIENQPICIPCFRALQEQYEHLEEKLPKEAG